MLSYETYKQNFHKFKLIRNFVSEDITEIIVSYAFAEIVSNKTIIDSFRFCNFESMIETYTDNTARIHYEDSIEDHMSWEEFIPFLWKEQQNFLNFYAIRPNELNTILHYNTDISLQSMIDSLTIQITISVERTFKSWLDNWLNSSRSPIN